MKRIRSGRVTSWRLAGLALTLALASAGAWAQRVSLGEIPLNESSASLATDQQDDESGGARAIAFDGVYIWVTRQFANNVVDRKSVV